MTSITNFKETTAQRVIFKDERHSLRMVHNVDDQEYFAQSNAVRLDHVEPGSLPTKIAQEDTPDWFLFANYYQALPHEVRSFFYRFFQSYARYVDSLYNDVWEDFEDELKAMGGETSSNFDAFIKRDNKHIAFKVLRDKNRRLWLVSELTDPEVFRHCTWIDTSINGNLPERILSIEYDRQLGKLSSLYGVDPQEIKWFLGAFFPDELERVLNT